MSGNHERPEQAMPHGRPAASEPDRTDAELEQAASDRDQIASDRDQIASARDQATSDRDQAAHGPVGAAAGRRTFEDSRAKRVKGDLEREAGTFEREATSALRTRAGIRPADDAALRDERAALRDATATARDTAADASDRAAAADLGQATGENADAARTRAEGAADRAGAAEDRREAARDRHQAHADVDRAQFDDLTGFYRRDFGMTLLREKLDRSRRGDGRLVLACIDVDGLTKVNDERGNAVGDQLVRDTAAAIRSCLRPYDLAVRVGGDEFVCALSGIDLRSAGDVFGDIQRGLGWKQKGASISVGLAALADGDTLEALTKRGDAELRRARSAVDTR